MKICPALGFKNLTFLTQYENLACLNLLAYYFLYICSPKKSGHIIFCKIKNQYNYG